MFSLFTLRTASFKKKKKKDTNVIAPDRSPPTCDRAGADRCESARTHLIRRLHEDVIGDLAEGQPQVNDVILRAASLGKVADVHHAAGARLPRRELGERESGSLSSSQTATVKL